MKGLYFDFLLGFQKTSSLYKVCMSLVRKKTFFYIFFKVCFVSLLDFQRSDTLMDHYDHFTVAI